MTRPLKIRFLHIVLVAALCAVLGIGSVAGMNTMRNAKLDALTFSGTQSWNMEMRHAENNHISFLGDAVAELSLPPPPKNSSAETASELELLHEYAESRRNPDALARIDAEQELEGAYFGEQTFNEIQLRKRETALLFERMLPEFTSIVIAQKKHFDRVRPSYLDPTLTTTMPVPEHPAYPSGHAAQSMLIALVLGELDPDQKEQYLESARTIAQNREIAGVHYPSDSAAGQLLAEQYFELLMKNERFKGILESARIEW